MNFHPTLPDPQTLPASPFQLDRGEGGGESPLLRAPRHQTAGDLRTCLRLSGGDSLFRGVCSRRSSTVCSAPVDLRPVDRGVIAEGGRAATAIRILNVPSAVAASPTALLQPAQQRGGKSSVKKILTCFALPSAAPAGYQKPFPSFHFSPPHIPRTTWKEERCSLSFPPHDPEDPHLSQLRMNQAEILCKLMGPPHRERSCGWLPA